MIREAAMRVGVLTFQFETNYGALLQAYCLRQAIVDLGHECSVIDYVPPAYQGVYERPLRVRGSGIRTLGARRWLERVHIMRKCDRFRREHLNLSPRARSPEALAALRGRFDAVVVGSDQVWNTGWAYGVDPAYFLDFAAGLRRVSYAACVGPAAARPVTDPRIPDLVRQLDAVSVRDADSAAWCHRVAGRTPEITLDPTLLHGADDLLDEHPAPAEPYIAVYSLGRRSAQRQAAVARAIASETRLPIVAVWTDPLWHCDRFPEADRHARGVGPLDWLRLLKHARFVLTDSFHCTIFALRFARPFAVFDEFETGRSARIHDLLRSLNIDGRMVRTEDEARREDLYRPVPESTYAGALESARRVSLEFLRRALSPQP